MTTKTTAEELMWTLLDEDTINRVLWATQDASEPATPSKIARLAKTETHKAQTALKGLEEMQLVKGEGNGAWRKYSA